MSLAFSYAFLLVTTTNHPVALWKGKEAATLATPLPSQEPFTYIRFDFHFVSSHTRQADPSPLPLVCPAFLCVPTVDARQKKIVTNDFPTRSLCFPICNIIYHFKQQATNTASYVFMHAAYISADPLEGVAAQRARLGAQLARLHHNLAQTVHVVPAPVALLAALGVAGVKVRPAA